MTRCEPTTPSRLRRTPPSAFARATADEGEKIFLSLGLLAGGVPRRGEGVFTTHSNGTPT
jgi:hypothetical protein